MDRGVDMVVTMKRGGRDVGARGLASGGWHDAVGRGGRLV